MVIGAIMARVDPRDVVIMKKHLSASAQNSEGESILPTTLNDLPDGSILGSSAVRRIAQLRATYPHLGTKVIFNAGIDNLMV